MKKLKIIISIFLFMFLFIIYINLIDSKLGISNPQSPKINKLLEVCSLGDYVSSVNFYNNELVCTPFSVVGLINDTFLNANYLKLDTSNDPLTDNLKIQTAASPTLTISDGTDNLILDIDNKKVSRITASDDLGMFSGDGMSFNVPDGKTMEFKDVAGGTLFQANNDSVSIFRDLTIQSGVDIIFGAFNQIISFGTFGDANITHNDSSLNIVANGIDSTDDIVFSSDKFLHSDGEFDLGSDNITTTGTIQGVTQTEFDTLINNSIADTLHRHSELVASDGSPDPALIVGLSGDVGIGTIPAYKLEVFEAYDKIATVVTAGINVNGRWIGIGLGHPDAPKGALIYEGLDASARGKIHFALKNTTVLQGASLSDSKMSIDYNGNVGIGTTAPTQKLDVIGNIAADYYFGNGSQLTGITHDNESWNESFGDTLYANISHTILTHDTDATGTELNTLTDNSVADTLHRHSELSASDGVPDKRFLMDAAGNMQFVGTSETIFYRRTGLDFSFNRNPDTGVMSSASGHGYQWHHTQSTTPASDRLEWQVYDESGTLIDESALGINGDAKILIGTTAVIMADSLVSMRNDVDDNLWSSISNQHNPGNNARAGYTMHARGNSWVIDMGSNTASAPNALQFSVDASSPIVKMTLLTGGNLGLGGATKPADVVTVIGNINVSGCYELTDGTVIGGSCVSDAQFKTNIQNNTIDINKMKSIKVKTFDWINETAKIGEKEIEICNQVSLNETVCYNETEDIILDLDTKPVGFVADEVIEVYPDRVIETDGIKRVTYGWDWIFDLWTGFQNHEKRIEELESENNLLKSELCRLNPGNKVFC